MGKNYVQPGNVVTVTAPYNLNPGDGCLVGSVFGVACGAYLANDANTEIELEGVFDLTALATDVVAAPACVPAYWDNTNKRVTTTVGSNTKIGVITKAKANGDTTARVRLNASF